MERLVRPQWPDADHPQQMHVDVLVEDLDAAEAEVLRLGATSLDAGTETFRVYTDPSGHPFCLVSVVGRRWSCPETGVVVKPVLFKAPVRPG